MDGTTAAEAGYVATMGQETELQQAVENFATANAADQTAFEQLTQTNAALQQQIEEFQTQNLNLHQHNAMLVSQMRQNNNQPLPTQPPGFWNHHAQLPINPQWPSQYQPPITTIMPGMANPTMQPPYHAMGATNTPYGQMQNCPTNGTPNFQNQTFMPQQQPFQGQPMQPNNGRTQN